MAARALKKLGKDEFNKVAASASGGKKEKKKKKDNKEDPEDGQS